MTYAVIGDMRDSIRRALHDVVDQFGPDALAGPANFKNRLGDVLGNRGVYAGDAKRLRNLLNIAVIDMNAYTRLKNAFAWDEPQMVETLISEMESEFDVKNETARIVIECVAELVQDPNYVIGAPRARQKTVRLSINVPRGQGYIYSRFKNKSAADVSAEYTVELGRGEARISDILDYAPGAVIKINKRVGEPFDLVINGKLAARGEAIIVDDKYGFRITELV